MAHTPIKQTLTRNLKIASFSHLISRAEAGLLDSYKERLDRLQEIKKQQENTDLNSEVIDECQKSESLALEAVQFAIKRLQEDDYGLCQTCQQPIEERRLTILPDIKHCFDCSH